MAKLFFAPLGSAMYRVPSHPDALPLTRGGVCAGVRSKTIWNSCIVSAEFLAESVSTHSLPPSNAAHVVRTTEYVEQLVVKTNASAAAAAAAADKTPQYITHDEGTKGKREGGREGGREERKA